MSWGLGSWQQGSSSLKGRTSLGYFVLGRHGYGQQDGSAGPSAPAYVARAVVNAEIPCFVHLLVVYCVITLPIGVWEEY